MLIRMAALVNFPSSRRNPEGADTIELAHWAYGEVLPRYARQNVRRHCLSFGIPRVGKRSRRFIRRASTPRRRAVRRCFR